jgi:hypothetical protein
MAKGTTDFARQTTEQAVQTTDWTRAIAEQNLKQSKAAFESLLTITRNTASGVDQQAAFIRDSMLFAEGTLELAWQCFDLAVAHEPNLMGNESHSSEGARALVAGTEGMANAEARRS